MTERSNTAIETAEAIIKVIEENAREIAEENSVDRIMLVIRAFAASLRLHQPAPRRRSRAKGE